MALTRIKTDQITDGAVTGDDINTSVDLSGKTFDNFTSTGIDDNAAATAITIDSSGNIGIGTSSPSQKLEVLNGSILVSSTATPDRSTEILVNQIKFSRQSGNYIVATENTGFISLSAGGTIGVDANEGVTVRKSQVEIRTDNTERMRVDSSGNVGIGTTSPYHNLQVGNAASSGYQQIAIMTNATGVGELRFADADDFNQGMIQYNHANDYMMIQTSSVERLRIDSSGRVGIGISNPGRELHVIGNIRVQSSGYPRLEWYNDLDTIDSNDYWIGEHHNDGGLRFMRRDESNSSWGGNLILAADGNVGIGEYSPTEKLEVGGNVILDAANATLKIKAGGIGTRGTVQWTYNTESTEYASVGIDYDTRASLGFHIDSGYPVSIDSMLYTRFMNNGSEIARFTSGGNLGIGTSSPSALLHVNGSATTAIVRIANAGSGAATFDGSGAGLELLAGGMNTTSQYTPAIKFGSTDSEFTTTNPKFGAAITATAEQSYTSDTKGGMDLRFYTAPPDPGIGSGLVERMIIDRNGKILAAAGTNWVGTVSQSGQSSVIERGSNANGEFVKFADGTMICTNRIVAGSLTFAEQTSGLWITSSQTTGVNFAATFTSIDSVSIDARGTNSTGIWGSLAGPMSLSKIADSYRYISSNDSSTANLVINFTGIGRWY